jgi:TolB-like protein
MSRKLVYTMILTLASYAASASVRPPKDMRAIVLLPVEQSGVFAASKLSDKELSNAVITRLHAIRSFEYAEFAELSKSLDDNIVDDAVFELLLTDGLTHVLARLNALETNAGRLAEYCKIGRAMGIKYLIGVSVQRDSTQIRVTYRVIDIATGRIMAAKSFYDVPNDPVGVCDEIANRLIRSLWKLEAQ